MNFLCFQVGAKRLEKAMEGIPDRIPVFAQMHEFVMHELKLSPSDFYLNPDVLVPGTLEVQKRYGFDMGYIDYDIYNIEAEALGQKVIYSDDSYPDADRNDPLVKTHDDLKKIDTPDFLSDGRFPFVDRLNILFKELTGLEPTLNFCAPFSLAANIRGIERLIYDIYEDPYFTRELFERITENVLVPWILFQKKRFPRAAAIVGSDATASIPIINMNILEEWVVPYIIRIREICGSEVYVPNWVGERYLKDPEEMFEKKLTVCPGFLEGQDPDVESIGPERYKRYAEEHDVALILGVGTRFLAESTPEEVIQRVKHYIEVGGKGGRFALYLCNLGKATSRENVKAVFETINMYGFYSGESDRDFLQY